MSADGMCLAKDRAEAAMRKYHSRFALGVSEKCGGGECAVIGCFG
jgi:hypothetical protein